MALEPEKDEDVDLQIAPMVNVMFVLLATFMATAGSSNVEKELGITVPGKAASDTKSESSPTTPLIIVIEEDGSIKWNGSVPMGDTDDKKLDRLRTKLKNTMEAMSGDPPPVIVRPRNGTKHSRIVDVLNICSFAKVKNLSFGG